MSDYTKITDFAIKDGLPVEDPEKTVSGVEIDAEFTAIQAAIASKPDSADITTVIVTEIAPGGLIDDAIVAGVAGATGVGGRFSTGIFAGSDGSAIETPVNCTCARDGTGRYTITLLTFGSKIPTFSVTASNEYQSPQPILSPAPPLLVSTLAGSGVSYVTVFDLAGTPTDPQVLHVLAVEPD